MPQIIKIEGYIGWDTTAESVRSQLKEANGKEIQVQVSSGGGSVFEGISIFNLIRAYKGEKSTKIIGLAASMGSYIALATDKVVAEDNAVYMIHNAWGFSGGDHRDMRKTANLLEGLSNILSRKYQAKTGSTSEEIAEMMNEETWLFGQDIVDAGFADEIAESSSEDSQEEALAYAKIQYENCNAKLKEEDKKEDLVKAVALFKAPTKEEPKQHQGAVAMTPEEKAKHEAEIAALELKLAEAEAKVVTEPAAPAAEPVAKKSTIDPKAIAKSSDYPDAVKNLAVDVMAGDKDIVALESLVAFVDMQNEQEKSKAAQADTDDATDTPAVQGEDSGLDKDGNATSQKGIYAQGAKIKEQMKGAK